MIRAILVALAVSLVSQTALADNNALYPNAEHSLSSDPAPVCSADLSLGGYDIKELDDIYSSKAASDVAPRTLVIAAQGPYQSPTTVASTNRNGGNLVLAPGQGKIVVGEIIPTTAAGKTLTFTPTIQGVVQSATVKTEGVSFNCAGLTSAQCAANVLGSAAVTGCTLTCIDGTCSNGQFTVGPTPGVSEYCAFATNDSTAFPLTAGDQGVDGQFIAPAGTASAPGLVFPGMSAGYGLYRYNQTIIGIPSVALTTVTNSTGGTVLTIDGTAPYFHLKYGAQLADSKAIITSPADGKLSLTPATVANGSLTQDISAFAKGQTITLPVCSVKTVTFAGGAGDASKATSGLIPDGAVLLTVSGRVTTAGTTCTSINIGDGSDPDMYGATIAVAQNTTWSTADATADWVKGYYGAGEVTVTGVGGNCVSLVAAITACYITATAATSN